MNVNRSRLVPGLILIGLGIFLLITRFTQAGERFFPFTLGTIFIIVYLITRRRGFLIPGGILTGLGTGIVISQTYTPIQDEVTGGIIVLSLGAGFAAIFVIEFFYTRTSDFWPLIPGGILGLVGTLLILTGLDLVTKMVLRSIGNLWPVVLIAIGAWILFRRRRDKGKEEEIQSTSVEKSQDS